MKKTIIDVSLLVCCMLCVFFTINRAGSSSVINQIKQKELMYFSATWCAPCQRLKKEVIYTKEFENFLKEEKIVLREIDISLDKQEAAKHNVRIIPTLIYEQRRLVGYHSLSQIKDFIIKRPN